MLSKEAILQSLPLALDKLEIPGDLPRGKVRDFYVMQDGKRRVLITTDRLAIFDHILGVVPFRGQINNELSAWWFGQTKDIVTNHFLEMPDANVAIVQETRPILLEIIVRGYITGVSPTSLWTRYAKGERQIYGVRFPEGLRKNDPLPHPVITATSKSTVGRDDRVIVDDVVGGQYVEAETWQRIKDIALALYQRGTEIASRGGLILADTKYEFGIAEEGRTLLLIDELHTPDSSRYWDATTYQDHVAAGTEPDMLDRELARLWYLARKDGEEQLTPALSEDLIIALSTGSQRVYEAITGVAFGPAPYPAQERIRAALAGYQ